MSRFIEFRVYRNGDWLPIPCTVEHATHNNVCTNRWYYVLSVEPLYFAHDLLSVFFPLAQIDSSRQSIASQIHLLLCSVHVRRIGIDLDTLGTHRRIISWIQLIMWPIRSHKRLIFNFTSSSTTVILAIFGSCEWVHWVALEHCKIVFIVFNASHSVCMRFAFFFKFCYGCYSRQSRYYNL